jgi:hypothetical protein
MPAPLGTSADGFIQHGLSLQDDDRFNEAALELFAVQFSHIEAYSDYCRHIGLTPETVGHWTEIPAAPTDAYKRAPLASFSPETAERVFMTSGTSVGPESRGRVYKDRAAMAVHDAVVSDGFRRWCLPDRERIRILVLAPPEASVPHLRMAHDCSLFLREFDSGGGRHFVSQEGLQTDALQAALEQSVADATPVLLVGATFSLVRFFDACREEDARYPLPPGSRLVDGGGYKGRSRELTKAEFLALAGDTLGLPETHCVNLLGITELTSLFFDGILAETLAGRAAARHKVNPPWTRTRAVDPETLKLLPAGQEGLLRHWDLANVSSVIALQTDDLGLQMPGGDGFEVLGRARGAELRGCSLAMEQFLDARH